MNEKDIRIDLGSVQTTLLVPLLARAREAEKKNPILSDYYARDIVKRIDYDFSKIEGGLKGGHQLMIAIRAGQFDNIIRSFIEQNRSSLVISIGAGLDTTFQRIDNGLVQWINIDLPDVVELRQKLIPDSERETTIPRSIFDFDWINDIEQKNKDRTVMFMAAGVLFYFTAAEVEVLFRKLAEAFPEAHFIFDYMSSGLMIWLTNRAILKKSKMDPSAQLKWRLKKGCDLTKWVDTIKIVEEYPMLSRVKPGADWDKKVVRDLKIADILGMSRMYNMIRIQF
ncbi:class I SAM-dependent methyltransferase [candidate division KSB1 bacterium]